jgi:hypothetical protein
MKNGIIKVYPGRGEEGVWCDMSNETRESLKLRESIEAMRLATEEINEKLGDAYPKGIVAEIEDIKRRIDALEKWNHEFVALNR